MKRKKIFFAGLAALFLFVAIGLTSCEMNQDFDYEFVTRNESSFTIRVEFLTEYRVNPRSFTLSPGAQRTIRTNHSQVRFNWERADTGMQIGVRFVSDPHSRDGAFRNW